ncbi:MAG: glucokinase [Litorimonas sp.]
MIPGNDVILAGDIGGTNVRFGCLQRSLDGQWNVRNFSKMQCSDYPSFDVALAQYIQGLEECPRRAAFAAAGPVEQGHVKLTNTEWEISTTQLETRYGFETCALYNDFAGMTRSVVELGVEDFTILRAGRYFTNAPILVAGAGTGFGVGYLIPIKTSNSEPKWQVISTEGGRMAYSAQTELEFALLQILLKTHDVVSLELISSGKNLAKVHKAMCEIHGVKYAPLSPDDIREQARFGDPICSDICKVRAVAAMGAIGDLALSGGARGGIVITGGVSERMIEHYMQVEAMNRYLHRGALSDYVKDIPMRLMTSPLAPLIGAAALLRGDAGG